MLIHRIKEITDCYYSDFYSIYSVSFPLHEQRSRRQQEYALTNANYHLECSLQENKVAGFIAYWVLDELIYIEHLAISPEMRGQHIGTKMLNQFIAGCDKPVVLEIDPIVDPVSQNRLHFYERLGFVSNPYVHFHPSYDPSYSPHRLIVLSAPYILSQAEYDVFSRKLGEVVMAEKSIL